MKCNYSCLISFHYKSFHCEQLCSKVLLKFHFKITKVQLILLIYAVSGKLRARKKLGYEY